MNPARSLLWKLLRPHRWPALVTLALLFGSTGLLLLIPGWSGTLVETVLPDGDFGDLIRHLLVGLGIVTGGAVLGFLRDYRAYQLGHRATAALRERLFAHVLSLPLARLDRTGSGELVTRFSSDVDILRHGLTQALVGLLPGAVLGIAFVSAMFVISWPLALATLAAVAPLVWAISIFERRMRGRTLRARGALSDLMTLWGDFLRGSREVKSFVQETSVGHRLADRNRLVRDVELRQDLVTALHPQAMLILMAAGLLALIFLGASMLRAGWVTGETLARFVPCLYIAVTALEDASRAVSPVSRMLAVLDRCNDLLTTSSESDEDRDLLDVPPVRGEIVLERLVFRHGDDGFQLGPLDVSIPAGQMVGLIGPSGAGKSTLLDVIGRFRDGHGGRLGLDGANALEYRRASLRSQIGFVPQEPALFEGTLVENLRLGNPHATIEEVEQAAQWAHVTEFAARLPHGYETWIGRQGATLSVGQKQRVALARALLKDPPILLLDEPTSALDPESERLIRGTLREVCHGRTTLIVAHRMSTLSEVDRILVLEGGRLVADGAPEQILARERIRRIVPRDEVELGEPV